MADKTCSDCQFFTVQPPTDPSGQYFPIHRHPPFCSETQKTVWGLKKACKKFKPTFQLRKKRKGVRFVKLKRRSRKKNRIHSEGVKLSETTDVVKITTIAEMKKFWIDKKATIRGVGEMVNARRVLCDIAIVKINEFEASVRERMAKIQELDERTMLVSSVPSGSHPIFEELRSILGRESERCGEMHKWCLVDHRYSCVHPDMLVEYDKDVGGSFMLDVRCGAKRCSVRAKLRGRG